MARPYPEMRAEQLEAIEQFLAEIRQVLHGEEIGDSQPGTVVRTKLLVSSGDASHSPLYTCGANRCSGRLEVRMRTTGVADGIFTPYSGAECVPLHL